jgi:hypothetical protein
VNGVAMPRAILPVTWEAINGKAQTRRAEGDSQLMIYHYFHLLVSFHTEIEDG